MAEETDSGTPSMVEVFGGSMMSPVVDPYPTYRSLRRAEPVKAVQTGFGPSYLVTRYEDVVKVLKDATRFSSSVNAKGMGLVMGRTILEMDGAEHVRQRNIIAPAFGPSAVRGHLAGVVRRFADELIDGFAPDGRADLVPQLALTLPMRVISQIIGVPLLDHTEFHRWATDLISIAEDPDKGLAASQRIVDYLRPVLEERKREAREDLLSKLTRAEVYGQRLTDEEVLSFLRLILPAGAETTYRLIGSMLFVLLTHPDLLEEVRADLGKIDLLINETLRWESPVQYVSRETTEPVALAGVELPADIRIQCVLGSANRDEEHYDDPDRFDLHRRAADHVAFGLGRHFCIGSHLARLEARTAVTALLERLPSLKLDPTQPCRVVGLAFRSPDRLPALFDPA